jgi:Fe-S cluster assembly protein SufD
MTLKALDIEALPTPRVEEWKYTNLAQALPKELKNTLPESCENVYHQDPHQVTIEPIEYTLDGQDGQNIQPRLKVHVQEHAELHLIERHTGSGAYWKNMVSEIILDKGAHLYHYRMQNDSQDAVQTNMVHIIQEENSHYECFTLNKGAKLTRHQIHAELRGENIECTLNGINLLEGRQHSDTTILMEHQAPHCVSNQNYRSVLNDQARGVFQGKVHVHRAAQKTDGYQLSNAILLSETAEMDTKPELEIYADDVKCSHGATTGRLDETPLFYMRSRGIPEKQARQILLESFLGELIDQIRQEQLQPEIKEQVDQWLAGL